MSSDISPLRRELVTELMSQCAVRIFDWQNSKQRNKPGSSRSTEVSWVQAYLKRK